MKRLFITKYLFWGFVLALFLNPSLAPVYAGDPDTDKIVKGLTESEPGSKEFKKAAEDAKKLNEQQAGEVAQKIVEKVTGDTATAVKTTLNLYKMGLKAAPDNPLLKKLGPKLADAIEKKMGNLMKKLKNPRTNGGKLQLRKALQDLGMTDENKILDIVEKLEKKVLEEEKKVRKKAKRAKSKSKDSMSFNAATNTLSFTDDVISEIFDSSDGSSDLMDSIVGANVIIPDYTYDGYTPEGEPGFFTDLNNSIEIEKDGDVFLKFVVPYLIWDDDKLYGLGTDIIISGAPVDSPYFGALPDLGSLYVEDLDQMLFPFDYKFYLDFGIIPDDNLIALTSDFTTDGITGFSNYIELNEPVPEPATMLLFGAGLIGFAGARRKYRKWRSE